MQEKELSTNQKKALVALLHCSTVAQAAETCGLTERTLFAYLANPTFKAELRKRQDQAIAAATSALSGLAGTAIDVLRSVLEDPDASHACKVRAALGVLDQRRKSTELDDLAARLSDLEGALNVDG